MLTVQCAHVCLQASFLCTPKCCAVISHLIIQVSMSYDEGNSFRVQLSAASIATCCASVQPKGQVNIGAGSFCHILNMSVCCSGLKSNSNQPSNYFGFESNSGFASCSSFASVDSKACSTSTLPVFCERALATSTALLRSLDTRKASWSGFTGSNVLVDLAACGSRLCGKTASLLTADFSGPRTVRVKALQLTPRTISAALVQVTRTRECTSPT